jgi:hypothetical protein
VSILDWDDGEVEIAGWISLTSDLEDKESYGKSSKLSIYGGVGLFIEDESTGLSWCFGGEHLNYNFELINCIENDNLYNRIHCFLIHY